MTLSDLDLAVTTDLTADISAITAQYGPIPDGLVRGQRRTLTDAWREHFTPLVDYLTTHRAHPESVTDEDLFEMLGVDVEHFGRFRGIHLIDTATMTPEEREEYYRLADGLFIEVHTRLGGGNRECWCEEGEHTCYSPTIERLQAHPDYVIDFDDLDDSTYASFFFAPDGLADLATRQQVFRLSLERARVLSGNAPPWFLYDTTHPAPGFAEIRRSREQQQSAERELAQLIARREDIVAAMAAPMPQQRPLPRMRPRIGAGGRKLKTFDPVVPTCTYAEAVARVQAAQDKLDAFLAYHRQVDALLSDPAYDLLHETFAREVANRADKHSLREEAVQNAITDRDLIVVRAHDRGTVETDERIASLQRRIEQCEAICDNRAHDWVKCWPGDLSTCPPSAKETS